jgi:hypothetical protein
VKELPGEPYRFDGLLFGFEDVAMVVYDGTAGKIWHNDDPPFGIDEFPSIQGVGKLKPPLRLQ